MFELVEASTLGRSSGRPRGARADMWGAVVVIARVCLDAGLRQLHEGWCEKGCNAFTTENGPDRLRSQLKKHHVKPWADAMPEDVHVRLRAKSSAGKGSGIGTTVNGPTSQEEIFQIITVLNQLRNGYAHDGPSTREELPDAYEGVLWVASYDRAEWSVQKPHAFSAIRAIESVYRYFALTLWEYPGALSARHALPQYFQDRAGSRHWKTSVQQDAETLSQLLTSGCTRDATDLIDQIRTRAILGELEASTPRLFDLPEPVNQVMWEPFVD